MQSTCISHNPALFAAHGVALIGLIFCLGTAQAYPDYGPRCAPCNDAPWAACNQPDKADTPWITAEMLRHADAVRRAYQSQSVYTYESGERRLTTREEAEASGYTIIDLSDNWVPRLLRENKRDGRVLQSVYAQRFVDLANDRVNIDGAPLEPDEQNFLEVYGIPPTLSVLNRRINNDTIRACMATLKAKKVTRVKGLRFYFGGKQQSLKLRLDRQRHYVDAIRKKYPQLSVEELVAKNRRFRSLLSRYKTLEAKYRPLKIIEERLQCQGLFPAQVKHRLGVPDYALALALRTFQRRHKIMDTQTLSSKTLEAFAKSPAELDYAALLRVLRRRLTDAAGIIEDGSVGSVSYRGRDGETHQVTNLTARFNQALLQSLGLVTPRDAQPFLASLDSVDLSRFLVAVRLPDKPDYYSDHMPLRVEIDRGTVWYDFPWRNNGVRVRQKRENMPMMTLYTRYRDQDIPLVRWPTTIGGWHAESAGYGGTEFMSYKNSDIGKRVIRDVVAAPVWLPPPSTPGRTLVKLKKKKRGRAMWELKRDLLGPGHRSAYGLVAGYLVIPGKNRRGDYDRGIRIHGSSNYTSITNKRAFSHGCHRMRNDQVTQLFGFVVSHRPHRVDGPVPSYFNVRVVAHGRRFKFRPKTRGFRYVLDPPLPVNVLKGDVRGRLKRPTTARFPKPRRRTRIASN
ncbi:MAG: hypothetical protein CMH52_14065 [Myxococcales bacterium]|nr:hypothetical protein [Myxococcales bacterium]